MRSGIGAPLQQKPRLNLSAVRRTTWKKEQTEGGQAIVIVIWMVNNKLGFTLLMIYGGMFGNY